MFLYKIKSTIPIGYTYENSTRHGGGNRAGKGVFGHGEDLGELGSYCEHGEADYTTTHIPMIIKWPGCAQNAVSHGFHYNLDLLPTLIDLLGGVPEFTGNRVVGKINPVQYDGESYADCVRKGVDGGRDHLIVSQCAHESQKTG